MDSIDRLIAKNAIARTRCEAVHSFSPTGQLLVNQIPICAEIGEVEYISEDAKARVTGIRIKTWIITLDSSNIGGLYQGRASLLYYTFKDVSQTPKATHELLIDFVCTKVLPLMEPELFTHSSKKLDWTIIPALQENREEKTSC